jgi:propionyl-CoA carboxylase beta chain
MVERHSYMFLTGPQVIRTVTGEEVDVETLGGADVHMQLSGTAHLAASGEHEALALCRLALAYLPANNIENPPYAAPADDPARRDDALNAIVPLDPTEPYSMHEVITRVVDRLVPRTATGLGAQRDHRVCAPGLSVAQEPA